MTLHTKVAYRFLAFRFPAKEFPQLISNVRATFRFCFNPHL